MTFKVGDKVRIIGYRGFYKENLSKVGEITHLRPNSSYQVNLIFEDGSTDWGKLEDLEKYI